MNVESHPYHHGDLRTALIESGLEFARAGGVGAIGLREITRSVGVTPNAAYRHFHDKEALVFAVAQRARELFAAALHERTLVLARDRAPADRAVEHLRGVGLGYIDFAVSEPGWFELAYLTQDENAGEQPSVTVQGKIPQPFQLLLYALDGLVDAEVLTIEQRQGAEWSCWSAVHGFADLATRGPFRTQNRVVVDRMATQIVNHMIHGILH